MPLQSDREIIRPQITFTSTIQDHNVYKNDFTAQNIMFAGFQCAKAKAKTPKPKTRNLDHRGSRMQLDFRP